MPIQFDNTNAGVVTLSTAATNTTIQFPTALGSGGSFLTTNGAGVLSFTSAGATLTGFTTSVTSTGVFATTNRSRLDVATLSASASIAIVPRASGSLLACIPDGTVVGGNSRGSTTSIDLQMANQRTNADQVASGFNSFIFGGYANKATGNGAGVVGGSTNAALGATVIVGGTNNAATLNSSNSVILGGRFNQMDSEQSVIVGGIGSTAWTGDFTTVYGSSNFGSGSTFGQAQTRYMCLTQVANANANFQLNNANVTASGLTTITADQATWIPENSAVLVKALVVQRRNTTAGNRAYNGLGLYRRGTGAATQLLNTNAIYGTSGTVTSWGFTMSVNTTSNTAAPAVSSTAGVASYICGYMQVLDLRYT